MPKSSNSTHSPLWGCCIPCTDPGRRRRPGCPSGGPGSRGGWPAPRSKRSPCDFDPAVLAAEAVVTGDRADGAATDDDAGAELAEHRAFRVEPGDVVGDAVLGGVRASSRHCRKGSTTSKCEGADRHVHPVGAERAVGPHGRVAAAHVHDGEGLGGAEVRVEGEADHDEEVADLVLAGEPHPLVGLGVGCPHHAHRIRARCGSRNSSRPQRGACSREAGYGEAPGLPRRATGREVYSTGVGRGGGASAWPEHSTLGRCPGTSGHRPRSGPRDPSSSGTTTTTCWRSCERTTPSTSAGPASGRSAATRTSANLSRDPAHFCSGRGALVNDPLRSEDGTDGGAVDPAHGPSRARRLPWAGQPTLQPRGACRAWPSRSARRASTLLDAADAARRSTSSPSWRRRSP